MATDERELMAPLDFDRELGLVELLQGVDRRRLLAALERLLDTPLRIAAPDGTTLCGAFDGAAGERRALEFDMETVGWLETRAPVGERITAALDLLQLVMQGGARYHMTSGLHLQAVHEDYQELQRQHAALQESEQRYRELSEQLEQRVAEQVRTIETTQRRLYQAEKMTSIGQLAAGVAHEINNPIGFIRSNLATAADYVNKFGAFAAALNQAADAEAVRGAWRRGDLDWALEDFQTLLAESTDGADRVAAIVRDLKGFSNVDGSEEQVVDLNETLQTVCNLGRRVFGEGVTVALNLVPLPPLRCRPGHLGQAFMNVLLNAAQAVGGAGEVRVATRLEGTSIEVSVSDDGAGMPAEVLARACEPFYTTREVGDGVGLGLTVCRDILETHGGEVRLASRAGQGTTVTLVLPVRSSTQDN